MSEMPNIRTQPFGVMGERKRGPQTQRNGGRRKCHPSLPMGVMHLHGHFQEFNDSFTRTKCRTGAIYESKLPYVWDVT
jgi:hypothetical protein